MNELGCMAFGLGLWAPLAYVGPGAGLSMLGALLAVSALALFALISPALYFLRLSRVLYTRLIASSKSGSWSRISPKE